MAKGAPFFNSVRKYVVSTTRTKDIWQNATFIATDVKKAIQKLKDEGGGDLTVHGSITLARWLIAEGLVWRRNSSSSPATRRATGC